MSRARRGFNREHVYEPSTTWDRLRIPALVRHHPAHIIHIPISAHNRMNAEQTQMATISDRLGRIVLDWADSQPLLAPEDRWKMIEQEALYLNRLGHQARTRMVGREAIYFAECLEIKLPFYKGEA